MSYSLDKNQQQDNQQPSLNLPSVKQEYLSQTDERQNYLTQMPEHLITKIQELGERSNPDEIKAVIVELCSWKSLSSSEIAAILGRNQQYLRTDYLTPLVRSGKLKQEKPSHSPQQTYTSSENDRA